MNNNEQKLQFQISELEYILTFLNKLKLTGYDSRMRTRFWKIIATRFEQYREEYLSLIKEHSELDENGEPKSTQLDNGSKKYEIKDIKLFQEELSAFLNEDFIIEIDDNNRKMINSVAQSILNCELSFEGQEAFNFDVLCGRFEDTGFGGEL